MAKNTKSDTFFIGWADTPAPDRRFFLGAGIGLTLAAAAGAAGLGALQSPPGPGQWDQADVREWSGVVTASPYPMLRTRDLDGAPRTMLLSCLGKCGVGPLLAGYSGRSVVITGSLIQRGRHGMIAVNELGEWIRTVDQPPEPALDFSEPEDLGEVDLAGEILDSKCWFGAMRPSQGKVHKSCASLCIRGGIPPAFFARDRKNRSALMILTRNDRACGDSILPYVADPVRITGRIRRRADLVFLDMAAEGPARI